MDIISEVDKKVRFCFHRAGAPFLAAGAAAEYAVTFVCGPFDPIYRGLVDLIASMKD